MCFKTGTAIKHLALVFRNETTYTRVLRKHQRLVQSVNVFFFWKHCKMLTGRDMCFIMCCDSKHLDLQCTAWSKSRFKVRKTAKIRKRYNQEPYLTQDTTWESNKNTINITNKSQEVSPFPTSEHKAAINRRESIRNTRHKKTQYDPQKK